MTTRKPRPCLQDMPHHIKAAIVEDFSFHERVPLRLLSSEFKNLADSLKMRENQRIYVHPNGVWFGSNTPVYKYDNFKAGCLRNGQLLRGVRFEDAALAHLDSYTSKPKLIFEKLTIQTPSLNFYDYSRFVDKFKEKCATRPLKVEYLDVKGCTEKEFLDFVPFMDSEILKSLEYVPPISTGRLQFSRIIETAQWRNLRYLKTRSDFLSQLPYESYAHIPNFWLDFQDYTADAWTVGLFKQWLSSPAFQSALINRSSKWITDAMRQEPQWQLFHHGSHNLFIDWDQQKCVCLKTITATSAVVNRWSIKEVKEFQEKIEMRKKKREAAN